MYTLFYSFLMIGAQAFGGGATLLVLLRREIVDKRGWMTAEELATAWSLCAVTPGINQIAISALIGHKTRGFAGAVVAALGLLTVGSAVTILLTLGYRHVQSWGGQAVAAALRGIVPATVGVGLLTCWQLLRPQLAPRSDAPPGPVSRRIGQVQAATLFIAAGLLLTFTGLPVVLILLACGSIGAIVAYVVSRGDTRREVPRP